MTEYCEVNDMLLFSSSYFFDYNFLDTSIKLNEINTQSNNNNSTISQAENCEIQSISIPKTSRNHHYNIFKTITVTSEKHFSVKTQPKADQYETGRWKKEECFLFIKGLLLYGIQWQKINKLIASRSAEQIRSHAQKFFDLT